MNPYNFIHALAIDPITFTFHASNDQLLRLEGRVPPTVNHDDEWVGFDACVEYQFIADAERRYTDESRANRRSTQVNDRAFP